MPAVECDGDRSFAQQCVKADHASRLIRQMKGRQGLADLRGGFSDATFLQPRHQTITSIGKGWASFSYRLSKAIQALAQRCVHVATMLKRFFQSFRQWF